MSTSAQTTWLPPFHQIMYLLFLYRPFFSLNENTEDAYLKQPPRPPQ